MNRYRDAIWYKDRNIEPLASRRERRGKKGKERRGEGGSRGEEVCQEERRGQDDEEDAELREW